MNHWAKLNHEPLGQTQPWTTAPNSSMNHWANLKHEPLGQSQAWTTGPNSSMNYWAKLKHELLANLNPEPLGQFQAWTIVTGQINWANLHQISTLNPNLNHSDWANKLGQNHQISTLNPTQAWTTGPILSMNHGQINWAYINQTSTLNYCPISTLNPWANLKNEPLGKFKTGPIFHQISTLKHWPISALNHWANLKNEPMGK